MRTLRIQVLRISLASAAILMAGGLSAHAADTVYTVTTTGTQNQTAATYTQTGTVSGHAVPDSTDAGNVLRLTTATATTLNLDQNVTLGGIRTNINGPLTIGAATGTLTLDATGMTLSTSLGNPFGNAGHAFLVGTSSGGLLTVGAPVVIANTDLDIGNTSGVNTGVTITGAITASTTQSLTFYGNGSGGLVVSGAIGATGSGNIAISNAGASTASLTISGALGANVISFTQGSATSSSVTLSGSMAAFTGTITLSAGNLTLSGVGPASGNALTMSEGTTLTLTNTTNASNDRITGDIVLGNAGAFILNGNGANSSVTEAVSSLKIGAGTSTVTLGGSGASRVVTLAAADVARTGNGTALIRGSSLGSSATNSTRITVGGTSGTGLILIGTSALSSLGAVTSGTDKQLKIVPYLIGSTSASGVGTNFFTYDANATTGGLRLLAVAASTAEQSLISSGVTNDNVKTIAGANVVSSGAKVFNSLLIGAGTNSSTPATTAATVTGAGGVGDTLTLTSGALANVATSATGSGNISGFSSIIFGTTGANEAIITNVNTTAGGELTIGSPINTASTGGGLTKAGGGTVILTANNLYTGATAINQGTLQIGNGGTTGDLGTNPSITIYTGATFNYNRTNSFSIGSVSGGGAVNNSNATGILTLNQAGTGLIIASIGGVSGSTVILDGTGTTTINALLATPGQLVKIVNGTINLPVNRGISSDLEIDGGTVNLNSSQFSTVSSAGHTQYFTMTGGVLNNPGAFGTKGFNGNGGAGAAGNAGTFIGSQTGGTFTTSGTSSSQLGFGSTTAGAYTSYTLSGGILAATTSASPMILGTDAGGSSTTVFNLSGGKLFTAGGISGTSGAGAKQNFVWTGGTLATSAYDATNLTSTEGTAVNLGVTNILTNGGGILAPGDIGTGGKTVITGNYSVTSANASYAVDIGSATVATAFQSGAAFYDQTIVTGTTALSGRLNVNLINGYTPPPDTTTLFAVLKGNTAATSTVTGTFTNLQTATGGNQRVVLADGLSSFLVAINNTAATATTGGLTNVTARNVALGGYQATNGYTGAGTDWDTGSAGAWANFDPGATATPGTQASGAIAQFADGTASTGSIGVSLNSVRNIQGIQFASTAGSRAYTISNGGSGAIILDNTSNAAAATIADTSASGTTNAVNVPLTLNSDLAVSVANATNTLSLGGIISGTGKTLTKTGAGILTLSGANTYTGGTTVSAGKLLVNNLTGYGTGTGALSIGASATLGGSGIIGSVTTIFGTLSPGNSPGTLTFTEAVTLQSGSTTAIEINSDGIRGTAFDGVNFNGGLTINGGTLTFNISAHIADGSVLNIFDGTALTSNFTSVTATGTGGYNDTFAYNGSNAYVGIFGNQTLSLALATGELSFIGAAIPEPSTYAALLGAAGLAFAAFRRRSRKP